MGSAVIDSSTDQHLQQLDVKTSLQVPAHYCCIRLISASTIRAKVGDSLTVSLGDEQDCPLIFTGVIQSRVTGLQEITIEAISTFNQLLNTHDNAIYEQSSAGKIVKAQLSRCKIAVSSVADGETFSSYRISSHSSLWQQCQQLATLNGFDFYADQQDKAVFNTYKPNKTHSVTYGENLLDFTVQQQSSAITGTRVYGASPVGQGQGKTASTWLTKKTVLGSAGQTKLVQRFQMPVATTKQMAANMAKALFEPRKVDMKGTIMALGSTQVGLGNALKLSNMPDNAVTGSVKVTACHHRLHQRLGCISHFDWEQGS
jgi:hypothetical protein